MAQRCYSPAWRHSLRFASWQRTISASCLFAALLAPQCAEATNVRKYILYVGSYTVRGSRGIYAYSFDASTGRLTPMGLETEVINPSFLTVEPSRRFLYSVSEIDNYKGQRSGALFAYRIDTKTGQLTPLNQVASRGSGPCFLS